MPSVFVILAALVILSEAKYLAFRNEQGSDPSLRSG